MQFVFGIHLCPGPVPHSVNDFWRMIWEYEVRTIAMLTNLEERGRVCCLVECLKVHCCYSRWFFLAICCGENHEWRPTGEIVETHGQATHSSIIIMIPFIVVTSLKLSLYFTNCWCQNCQNDRKISHRNILLHFGQQILVIKSNFWILKFHNVATWRLSSGLGGKDFVAPFKKNQFQWDHARYFMVSKTQMKSVWLAPSSMRRMTGFWQFRVNFGVWRLRIGPLNAVSQTQINESECERRRGVEQRAGWSFVVDSVSRVADE